MLHSKTLRSLLLLFLFNALLSACGGSDGGDDDIGDEAEIVVDTEVTGLIQLPDGVDTDGEYPVTVQAFYGSDCTETEPDAVFSDTNGDYSITVNCGGEDQIYLVYASRTGDYGLIQRVDIADGSQGDTISEAVTIEAMEPVTTSVTIADGFNGAYDYAELELGITISSSEIIPFDSILTFDGNPVFDDHKQTVSASGNIEFSRVPLTTNSGYIHNIIANLIGDYDAAGSTIKGILQSTYDWFLLESGTSNTAEIIFDSTTSLLQRKVRFTSNGVYDDQPPEGFFHGSGSTTIHLSSIPLRQDIFHLTLTFMDNISVTIDGVPVVSGVEMDFDLSSKPVADVVLDIVNTVSGETDTYTYSFTSDENTGVTDNTEIIFYYYIDSDVRGPYTTASNRTLLRPEIYHDSYSMNVDYSVDEVELTFLKQNEYQEFTLNDVSYPEETYLGETFTRITVPIVDGDNIFNIAVTAEDSNYTNTYPISIFQQKAYVADLISLSIWSGGDSHSIGFDSATTMYYVNTEASTAKIVATAYSGSGIRVLLNGTEVEDGATQVDKNISLVDGVNTVVVEVTSADGTTAKNYTVEITQGGIVCIPDSDLPCTL